MLSAIQLSTMVVLQNTLNEKINPDWIVAGNDWMLAGAMELMEGIDHHGWKWWKHQEPNIPMLQIELIDYWHFVLSQSIINSDDLTKAYYWLMPSESTPHDVLTFDGSGYVIAEMTTVEKMFLMVGLASSGRFNHYLFESIMADVDLTWNVLFDQYISKNVLNVFRQNHGYKDGSYVKEWIDGREDNAHMIDIMTRFSDFKNDENYPTILYDALEMEYQNNFKS